MLRKIALVVAAAAALVPLGAGSASASCTDDLVARNLFAGASYRTYSGYTDDAYVGVNGVSVHVYGNEAVYDTGVLVYNMQENAEVVPGNVLSASLGFVNCVAG